MLKFELGRSPSTPRDASTVIPVRASQEGLHVLVVRRAMRSSFLGGALVFPGGKVDPDDAHSDWVALTTSPAARATTHWGDADQARPLLVAACRELLEEAGLLPTFPTVGEDVALELAQTVRQGAALSDALRTLGLQLDLSAILPFGRWVTPEAEARRFDARFFLWVAPQNQDGRHDGREITQSFWAAPQDILARAGAGEFFLAPPTSRCLELLATVQDVEAARALADTQCLEVVCPVWVAPAAGRPGYLALPGDPSHPIREALIAGPSRYVQRGERFCAEDPEVPSSPPR